MKPKVTKITIEIGGQKLKLTPEQARELRDELNGIVGDVRYIPQPVQTLPYLPAPYIGDAPPLVPWSSSGTAIPSDSTTITISNETCDPVWLKTVTNEIARQVTASGGLR